MRRPRFGAACTGAAIASLVLAGCGGPRKQPERILGWDRPSPSRPAAPVENRVPKPTPATVAVVKAVTASSGTAASSGTSGAAAPAGTASSPAAATPAAVSAPAPAVAAAPAPTPAPAPPPAVVAVAPAPVAPAGPATARSLAPAPSSLPSTLYFEIDHYRVKPKDHELLQQHAAALKANPGRVLMVRGHADSQGPAEYNRALADKRAETVAKLLASMGVDPRQIRHEAAAPSGSNATDSKPQREARRVELVYVEMGAVAGR